MLGANLAEHIATDPRDMLHGIDRNDDGIAQVDNGAYEFNSYRFGSALQTAEDGFQFTVRDDQGEPVRIERSRDLVNWEYAGAVPIPASGQTLIDPVAGSEWRLFYRIMRVLCDHQASVTPGSQHRGTRLGVRTSSKGLADAR